MILNTDLNMINSQLGKKNAKIYIIFLNSNFHFFFIFKKKKKNAKIYTIFLISYFHFLFIFLKKKKIAY